MWHWKRHLPGEPAGGRLRVGLAVGLAVGGPWGDRGGGGREPP